MSARHQRVHLAFVLLAGLAALAASCARELPTAAPAATARRTSPLDMAASPGDDGIAVTLVPGVSPADVAETYGAAVLEVSSGQAVASLAPAPSDSLSTLLTQLSSDPRVATAETNLRFEPPESEQKSFAFDDGHNTVEDVAAQPALAAIRAAQALAVSRGDGVRVAILDTGIDPGHPIFAGRIAASYDFLLNQPGATDVAQGIDTNGDGVVDGAWGHGTHVAGIVAMVAPGAKLLVGRVLNSDGQGDVVTVAAGIRWAVQNGADVINLSLGSVSASPAIASAISDAEEHGAIVFAAAGNHGAALPREFPASFKEAVAVAATDAYASPAPWSSFAPYVALSAPGVAIRSAYPGGLYRQWSGTSMSTPFVAATAALLLGDHPYWDHEDLVDRLASAATPLVHVSADRVGMMGAGMLNAGDALAPDATGGDQAAIQQPGRH